MKLVELKGRRETYGHDERAINKHSVRVYRASGFSGVKRREPIEFFLNSTLDGPSPYYCLYFYKPVSAMPTMMRVDMREYWGDGLSWSQAEQRAFAAIEMLLLRRNGMSK